MNEKKKGRKNLAKLVLRIENQKQGQSIVVASSLIENQQQAPDTDLHPKTRKENWYILHHKYGYNKNEKSSRFPVKSKIMDLYKRDSGNNILILASFSNVSNGIHG